MDRPVMDARQFSEVYADRVAAVLALTQRIVGNVPDAEDVTQDVFLRLWERPDAFDASRGDIAGYLRLVARSRAIDARRRAQAGDRAVDRMRAGLAVHHPVAPSPALAAEASELRARLSAALERVPPAQRRAVLLAHLEDLPDAVVAALCDVPLGTAKSRIRLALLKLHRDLADTAAD